MVVVVEEEQEVEENRLDARLQPHWEQEGSPCQRR